MLHRLNMSRGLPVSLTRKESNVCAVFTSEDKPKASPKNTVTPGRSLHRRGRRHLPAFLLALSTTPISKRSRPITKAGRPKRAIYAAAARSCQFWLDEGPLWPQIKRATENMTANSMKTLPSLIKTVGADPLLCGCCEVLMVSSFFRRIPRCKKDTMMQTWSRMVYKSVQ
jgi:hypothetical protein